MVLVIIKGTKWTLYAIRELTSSRVILGGTVPKCIGNLLLPESTNLLCYLVALESTNPGSVETCSLWSFPGICCNHRNNYRISSVFHQPSHMVWFRFLLVSFTLISKSMNHQLWCLFLVSCYKEWNVTKNEWRETNDGCRIVPFVYPLFTRQWDEWNCRWDWN